MSCRRRRSLHAASAVSGSPPPSVELFTLCMDSVASVFQWTSLSVPNSVHAVAVPDLAVGTPRAGRCALQCAAALSWSTSLLSEIGRRFLSPNQPFLHGAPVSFGLELYWRVLGVIIATSVFASWPLQWTELRDRCVCTRVRTSTQVEMASAHWYVPSQHASVSSFPKFLFFFLVRPFSSCSHTAHAALGPGSPPGARSSAASHPTSSVHRTRPTDCCRGSNGRRTGLCQNSLLSGLDFKRYPVFRYDM